MGLQKGPTAPTTGAMHTTSTQ
eukprot:SAG11_NODE_21328_length_427_cov_1.420732_1_plen_21_part_10